VHSLNQFAEKISVFVSNHIWTILIAVLILGVVIAAGIFFWYLTRLFVIKEKDESPQPWADDKEIKKHFKILFWPDIYKNIAKFTLMSSLLFTIPFIGLFRTNILHGVAFLLLLTSVFLIAYYYFAGYINDRYKSFDDIPGSILKFLARPFYLSKNFYYLGKYKKMHIGLPERNRYTHIMVVGPTDARKTTSFIVPQLLLDSRSDASAFVPDAKAPELFNLVAGRWIAEGKKVIYFNPWDPRTVGCNPLHDAVTDDELMLVVEVLMKEREDALKEEPFFKARTKEFMFYLLKLVQQFDEQYRTLPTVFQIIKHFQKLEQFLATVHNDDLHEVFRDFMKMSAEAKINTLTSIRGKLNIFLDQQVCAAFSRADFTLDRLFNPDDPILFIVGAPLDKQETGQKIVSLLSNLVIKKAFGVKTQALSQSAKGSKLFFYGDEGRALKITALADIISMARYTGTQILMSFTDFGFLRYYREDEDTIKNCFRTKIILRGLSYSDARLVSEELGKTEKPEYKYFKSPIIGAKTKQMIGYETKPVMQSDEVTHLAENQAIVFNPLTRPFIIQRVSYFESEMFKKLILPPPTDMKKFYQKWNINTDPLIAPSIERIPKSFFYDIKTVKTRKKHPEPQPSGNEDIEDIQSESPVIVEKQELEESTHKPQEEVVVIGDEGDSDFIDLI